MEGSDNLCIKASDGCRIAATLRAAGAGAPLVLLAPGLTGTQEGPLEHFAGTFRSRGINALTFDFRTLGRSEGHPRHWVDPVRQRDDYLAVLGHVRQHLAAQVDLSRIFLWGSSFSAAAALCAAEHDGAVAGVIAQVPWLGGEPVHAIGRRRMLGYVARCFLDLCSARASSLLGITLPAVHIAAFGKPDEAVFAPSRDNPGIGSPLLRDQFDAGFIAPTHSELAGEHPFWCTLPAPQQGGWANRLCARGLASLDAIDPGRALRTLRCPVLLVAAADDDMIDVRQVRSAAHAARNARLVELPGGHYDPYVEPLFGRCIAEQVAFVHAQVDARMAGEQALEAGACGCERP